MVMWAIFAQLLMPVKKARAVFVARNWTILWSAWLLRAVVAMTLRDQVSAGSNVPVLPKIQGWDDDCWMVILGMATREQGDDWDRG